MIDLGNWQKSMQVGVVRYIFRKMTKKYAKGLLVRYIFRKLTKKYAIELSIWYIVLGKLTKKYVIELSIKTDKKVCK